MGDTGAEDALAGTKKRKGYTEKRAKGKSSNVALHGP